MAKAIIPVEERRRRARLNYRKRRAKDLVGQQMQQRIVSLKYRYGLTPDGVRQLLDKQRWTCPITGDKLTESSHVDHCHKTGKVRGVLSPRANLLLGKAGDSIEILQRAIRYLAETS